MYGMLICSIASLLAQFYVHVIIEFPACSCFMCHWLATITRGDVVNVSMSS